MTAKGILFAEYVAGVVKECAGISATHPGGRAPAELVEAWGGRWKELHKHLASRSFVYECVGMIAAHCEFLGALYLGTTKDTNWQDYKEFTEVFLGPVRTGYKSLHNHSGLPGAGSDLYTCLRTKPLHGFTPAGAIINGYSTKQILSWTIGVQAEVAPSDHMTVKDGCLHVNCDLMSEDFDQGVGRFVTHLQGSTSVSNRTPVENFMRGFWGRFRPRGIGEDAWAKDGVKQGHIVT